MVNKLEDAPKADWFLRCLPFAGGVAVMWVEMCASRLIQPYFGDSLLIWANLIGFVMLYLAVGYFVGGKLADRYPRASLLYQLVAWAAFLVGLIPLISSPILGWAAEGFLSSNGGLFLGSLFGILVLFSAPLVLLGMVSPFVIRLQTRSTREAGNTAGRVTALSTIGSLAGTFLPVLLLIPSIGTRASLYLLSVLLLVFILLQKITPHPSPRPSKGRGGNKENSTLTHPSTSCSPEGRGDKAEPSPSSILYPPSSNLQSSIVNWLMLLVIIGLWVAFPGRVVRPAAEGELLYEKESAYNYIQVVRRGEDTYLMLNEGLALHSVYNPQKILSGGPWDYFMLAPFFNKGMTKKEVKKVLLIGLGGGTVAKQISQAYSTSVAIDGIELDPAIVAAGRKYFDMNEPNLNAIAQDGRYFLITSRQKYDIIGMDAYRQPYIPFYLTTKEFFQQVREHLTVKGVTVANAGSPKRGNGQDYRLANQLAANMKAVFPSVFIVDVAGYYSTMVFATNQATSIEDFKINILEKVESDLIKETGKKAVFEGNIREWTDTSTVFTDDLAPIERLIDQIIIDYATGGNS